jgi:hypothetical protein
MRAKARSNWSSVVPSSLSVVFRLKEKRTLLFTSSGDSPIAVRIGDGFRAALPQAEPGEAQIPA